MGGGERAWTRPSPELSKGDNGRVIMGGRELIGVLSLIPYTNIGLMLSTILNKDRLPKTLMANNGEPWSETHYFSFSANTFSFSISLSTEPNGNPLQTYALYNIVIV